MLFLLKRYFFFCLVCVTLACCAWIPKPTTVPAVQEALEKGRTLMANNAHIQALAVLSDAYNKHRQKNILDMYVRAARQALAAGDDAYQRKEYAEAGMLYHALQESKIEADQGFLRPDQNYLEKQIRGCSRALSDKGLKEYRDQNLSAAIAAWEEALQFDPNNGEVARAISKASGQRARLLSMD